MLHTTWERFHSLVQYYYFYLQFVNHRVLTLRISMTPATFYVGLLIYLVTVPFASALHGAFKHENFTSATLNEVRNYAIYLPPSYYANPDASFPLVVFLHGTELNELDYPEVHQISDSLMASGIQFFFC